MTNVYDCKKNEKIFPVHNVIYSFYSKATCMFINKWSNFVLPMLKVYVIHKTFI